MSRPIGIILTTYRSQARDGKNLGSAGYSYDFVVKQFLPELRSIGEVVELAPREELIEREAEGMRDKGTTPIHLCFMPFQHACLSTSVPNVVVPAWEFPDVPDHEFDGEARNNWVAMANRSAAVIVGGPWTADVFRRGGIHSPIYEVPVPTPAWNYSLPRWDRFEKVPIGCSAIDCRRSFGTLHTPDARAAASAPGSELFVQRQSVRQRVRHAAGLIGRALYKRGLRPLLPPRLDVSLTAGLRSARQTWRSAAHEHHYGTIENPELSGVVYTSIFNPEDGRKNWEDLITGFLLALRDRPDATLVLKLVARNRRAAEAVLGHYSRLDLDHECRLVIITDYLSREQMSALARATTYYVTTTRAEGNCLPLMDYLAAGRPAISPCHTAISDYFGNDVGFVIESHAEPAAWPQDCRLRCRTAWNRIVWTSLAEQLRASYETAATDDARYGETSRQARQKMQDWSHPKVVRVRLSEALAAIAHADEHRRTPRETASRSIFQLRAA